MIVGVTMVKDEIDVLPYTLGHLTVGGVERFVIADNGSTDGTREYLDQVGDIARVLDDPVVAFEQSEKITALIHAHCSDGDWIVPFDADELWTDAHGGPLAGALRHATAPILTARVYDYLPHDDDDQSEPDPFRRIRWREPSPEPLPVVAFLYHPDAVVDMGNHGVRRPGEGASWANGLRVRHLQYRSLEHFVRKSRNGRVAIEASGQPPGTCQHWRDHGARTDEELAAIFADLVAGATVLDPWT